MTKPVAVAAAGPVTGPDGEVAATLGRDIGAPPPKQGRFFFGKAFRHSL